MNAKLALCAVLATLTSACAGTPTWDNGFPQQMSYGGTEASPPAAVAAAPTK